MRPKPTSALPKWSLFNALFLLALGLAEAFVGERTSPTALLLYLPQHPFGLLTLVLLAISLKVRNFRQFGLNLVVGLAFVVFLLGLHVPLRTAPPQGKTLRIMTWNIEKLKGTPEALAAVIKAQNPDIVCMQETLRWNKGDRTPELLRLFPGWQFRRAREVTTMSRFPLLESRDYLMPQPSARKLLATTWQTPNGPLTVLNTHIATAVGDEGKDGEYGLLNRAIRIAEHGHGTAMTRAKQLPTIYRALADCTTPVVMTGDFNNPPRGRFYRHLKNRLSDAFAEAGWGLGESFPSNFPLIRIDYIWLGKGIHATRCFNPTSRASDHLPLVADIVQEP